MLQDARHADELTELRDQLKQLERDKQQQASEHEQKMEDTRKQVRCSSDNYSSHWHTFPVHCGVFFRANANV